MENPARRLFFELALEDLTRAADLFRPIYEKTNGVDGCVSLEVSPLLAYDTASTIAAAKDLSARANRANLFIKIPGTKEGLPAIEEAIFSGVPINVTLLFSREQYLAAADAFLRGIERRIAAGLNPNVDSVASRLHQPVGCRRRRQSSREAAQPTGNCHHEANVQGRERSVQFRAVAARLQFRRAPATAALASTGTKDPKVSPLLYVEALASPYTVNTMPEATLKALAAHSELSGLMPPDGGDCEKCSRNSARRASTSTRSPRGFRKRERNRSWLPGTT